MRQRTVLEYQRYRYLKVALLLVLASILAYVLQDAPVGRYGGTWVGYGLGTLAALMIVWLMWFGVRKRSYMASASSVRGWLSAHVYLGATLIVITTLHAAFQIGWNIHTLAYVLLLMVVFSGFYGVYAYLQFPTLLSENLANESFETLQQKIEELNKDLTRLVPSLPAHTRDATRRAITATMIGGGVRAQLRSKYRNCPTDNLVSLLSSQSKDEHISAEEAQRQREAYAIALRKQKLVARARAHIRYKAILAVWLYVHVPLSFALLAALVAHIVSVFFYW
jgi:hypothetical protein